MRTIFLFRKPIYASIVAYHNYNKLNERINKMNFSTIYDSASEMTITSRVQVSIWNCAGNLRTTQLEQCAAASKYSSNNSEEQSAIQRLIRSLTEAFPDEKTEEKDVEDDSQEKYYDDDSRGSKTLLPYFYDPEYDSDYFEDDESLLYDEEDLILEERDEFDSDDFYLDDEDDEDWRDRDREEERETDECIRKAKRVAQYLSNI